MQSAHSAFTNLVLMFTDIAIKLGLFTKKKKKKVLKGQ